MLNKLLVQLSPDGRISDDFDIHIRFLYFSDKFFNKYVYFGKKKKKSLLPNCAQLKYPTLLSPTLCQILFFVRLLLTFLYFPS